MIITILDGSIETELFVNSGVLVAKLSCKGCGTDWRWQSLGEDVPDMMSHARQLMGSILFTGNQPAKILR